MFFSLPWMLLGLLGLPALAAIYWLRSHSRPKIVSSLFLWSDQQQPHQGGRRIERLQTPLTFFLELLALTAIALAAAAPGMLRSRLSRPLVIILDDSFSMQAKGKIPVRTHAIEKLIQEFRRENYVARIIFAGQKPQLLSDVIRTSDQLKTILQDWSCPSPSSNLDAAVALAGEIGGETARLLVITDHAPASPITSPRVQWWGLGASNSNLAITSASRSSAPDRLPTQGDRVFLEVTNFSPQSRRTILSLSGPTGPAPQEQVVQLTPGGSQRIVLTLPVSDQPLQVVLPEDALEIDNKVHLLSPRQRPLRVRLSFTPDDKTKLFQTELTRAFEATGQTILTESRPDLTVSLLSNSIPEAPAQQTGDQWTIVTGDNSVSYEGPFILDRSHPLATGLSLDGIIWSVPAQGSLTGPPVVTAGNRVLMTDLELADGSHDYRMLLTPELSTLTVSPDWPILVTNLVRRCLTSLPGLSEVNVRLEQPLTLTLPDEALGASAVEIIAPDQKVHSLPIHGRFRELQGNEPGIYQARAGSISYSFAVNALSVNESNLTDCQSGLWGNWDNSALPLQDRLSLDWICILIALACLALELILLSRSGVTGA